ncbi:Uncharacterized protein YjbI, contains pentapeptide repeats [Geodermatophilus pulveris]|uniref:Uncharacterized protein YjbI, contains pentapeptide repeats n=1 Tax=Geodermatophilus pulveris TaxID=1564159 RepID=A0A239DM84_9ACTN|nr:pentapeptide repeat-containing protein [Geodermatophilus pulveris]SNS32783.1 Uncharacterized protein YjbI, contains pentapeptide repeats [Geodermatophilus pulveris]
MSRPESYADHVMATPRRDSSYMASATNKGQSRLGLHGRDLVIALLVALLGVGLTFLLDNLIARRQADLDNRIAERQEKLDSEIANRQEVLENLRFVRERAGDPNSFKPFSGLNLAGANLRGLRLDCPTPEGPTCADFSGAILTDVDFEGANVSNATFEGARLQRARFFAATAIGVEFWRADLREASLDRTSFSDASFANANLTGAAIVAASMNSVSFEEANLTGVFQSRSSFAGANMRNATLVGVDFARRSVLNGVDLSGANLNGAILTGDYLPPDLTNICYSPDTLWPEGFTPPAPVCHD